MEKTSQTNSPIEHIKMIAADRHLQREVVAKTRPKIPIPHENCDVEGKAVKDEEPDEDHE